MNHDFRAAMRRATRAIQHAVTAGEANVPPPGNAAPVAGIGARPLQRVRQPLGETLRALREGRLRTSAMGPLPGMSLPGMKRKGQPPPIPDGARFFTRSFTCAAGTRAYKLYIPAAMTDRPRGLIVTGLPGVGVGVGVGCALATVREICGVPNSSADCRIRRSGFCKIVTSPNPAQVSW